MVFILNDLYEKATTPIHYRRHGSFVETVNLVTNRIRNGGLSLIWGPPGTGKTTAFAKALEDTLPDIQREPSVVLYIAPTNKLVAEMYQKIAGAYKVAGFSKEDFIDQIKVYGSQFKAYRDFAKQFRKIDPKTKCILTTPYQTPYLPLLSDVNEIHLLIDEASKSPLHVPFIPLVPELSHYLTNESSERLVSVNVAGDPNQAIGIGELRGRRDLLLFLRLAVGLLGHPAPDYNNIQEVLERAVKELKGRYLSILDTSYRIPHPSEKPISQGFYDGILKSEENAEKRLEGLWDRNLAENLKTVDETFRKVVSKLEEAITTGRNVIYVHMSNRCYTYRGELFDEQRAKAGLYFAVALSRITGERVMSVTTYSDQAQRMKHLLSRNIMPKVGNIGAREKINILTAHKALGSEENHIVVVLGKEYSTSFGLLGADDETIYYAEPEVLNVQLSRHKKILIVIGNLQRLINTVSRIHSSYGTTLYMNLKKTAEELLNLCGCEIRSRRLYHREAGEGGVFFRWG